MECIYYLNLIINKSYNTSTGILSCSVSASCQTREYWSISASVKAYLII